MSLSHLNPFAISGLLIVFLHLPLLIILLINGKTKASKMYGFQAIAIMLWGAGSFLIGMNKNPDAAVSLTKISFLPVIFIPILFYHTVLFLTNEKQKKLLIVMYLQGIIFSTLTLFNMMFLCPRYVFNSFYVPSGSFLYLLTFICWLLIVYIAHTQLWKYYKKVILSKKNKLFSL